MNPLLRRSAAAGVVLAVAAATWFAGRTAGAPPRALVDAAPTLRWREGTSQQYRLVVDSTVRTGGMAAEHAPPIHQEVRGVLEFRTLAVGPEGATVGMRLSPVELRVGGVSGTDLARALEVPFRVRFDRTGEPRRFEFARDVDARRRSLLEELVRTFQVVVRGERTWLAEETHATGRYEARYEREDAARLRRTKTRYFAAGPDGQSITVPAATATVQLAATADWIAGMVVDETLDARDESGVTFAVATHATLELLPAGAVAAATAWTFPADAADDGGAAGRTSPIGDRPLGQLAADLAEILAALDAAREGRIVWIHRLRDLLRADQRLAALLLGQMRAQDFTDRTRADLFLALELGGTVEAQAALARVVADAAWQHRDRTRALIALGGVDAPTEASVSALWAAARERSSAANADLANTAMLALGTIGGRMPHGENAAYANLRDGLLSEAFGARHDGERAIAVLSLANTGDRTLGKELTPFLDDAAPDVRRAAAKAVGKLGDDDAIVGLALRLQHEPDSAVRAALAAGLSAGPATPPEVLTMARAAVGAETDEATRLALARCLGRNLAAHPDNEQVLRTLLASDASDKVRRYVGEVLGRADAARER